MVQYFLAVLQQYVDAISLSLSLCLSLSCVLNCQTRTDFVHPASSTQSHTTEQGS